MQQEHATDISVRTMRLLLMVKDKGDIGKSFKMFASKAQTSNSTFYTELETDTVPDKRSDLEELAGYRVVERREQERYDGHLFPKIPSFGGFSRFRSFVMSAGNSTEHIEIEGNGENSLEVPYVRVSHSVLEYRSSR